MRPFVTLALTVLSFAGLSLATPLDTQIVLPGNDRVEIQRSWSYDDCGSPEDLVQIESIVVSPDPPLPGKDLTVKVIATAKETIEDGAYADVVVKLGLIKLLSKTFDICEEARNANASVQCPVQPGPYVVSHTVSLPKEIPPAKFDVLVNAYTREDEDLLCLKLKADFTVRPFPRW